MKKNIISVVICFCMLFSIVCTPIHAEASIVNIAYELDYETGKVVLSFSGAIAETRATVVVMNPGFSLDNAHSDGAIQYQREVTADASGAVKVDFVLNGDINLQNDVNYPVYVKIPGREAENILSICVLGVDKKAEAINALKAGKEEISSLLTNREMRLGLGIEYFKPYRDVDNALLIDRLVGKFDSFESTSEDFSDVCAYLKQFCIVELYNQNMKDKVYSEAGEYLWENVLGFNAFDKENEVTVYKCYSELLSDSAKEKVRASLFEKDIETPKELMKMFAVNTVLYGIPSPKLTGYAHIEKLLTLKNRNLIELEIKRGLNADEEAQVAAYQGTFENVDALETYLNELIGNNKGGSGGGGGGGSSSGGSGGGGIGGSSSGTSGKGTGAFSADDYVTPPEKEADKKVFEDISDEHWAVKPIAYLKAKGVVNGMNGDNFVPDAPVTREQFVKMLFAILNIEAEASSESVFNDVENDMWYTPYINTAVTKGIINGISDKEFGVGRYASRQDLCTMLYRAIELKASTYKEFSDGDSISDYAYDAVGVLSSKGIVNGYPDGSFKPLANCTRAEAATMIYNAAMIMEVK